MTYHWTGSASKSTCRVQYCAHLTCSLIIVFHFYDHLEAILFPLIISMRFYHVFFPDALLHLHLLHLLLLHVLLLGSRDLFKHGSATWPRFWTPKSLGPGIDWEGCFPPNQSLVQEPRKPMVMSPTPKNWKLIPGSHHNKSRRRDQDSGLLSWPGDWLGGPFSSQSIPGPGVQKIVGHVARRPLFF